MLNMILLSPDVKVNIVLREEKPQYCSGKDCILIDDMEKNIQEWEEMNRYRQRQRHWYGEKTERVRNSVNRGSN